MSPALLDVKVLIALAWPNHVHQRAGAPLVLAAEWRLGNVPDYADGVRPDIGQPQDHS